MVKKPRKAHASQPSEPPLSSAVKDSAQQIWLAGLGAFSKAQEEGSKVFETLVKEGLTIQRKTQKAAEEKISETASRVNGMATDLQAKAGHRWDKLENIFEERVAKALSKLGVPSLKEVTALTDRLDQLEKQLHDMKGATSPTRRAKAKPATSSETPPSSKAARPAAKKAMRAADPAGTDTPPAV